MRFFADLHIHSKYSRATSRECNLEVLAFWARRKGISVLGTGDFTHPAWIAEITEKTVPAEPGLLRLRPDLEKHVAEGLHTLEKAPGTGDTIRFLLSVEISTIYKKGDCTRKVHHILCVPTLEAAKRLNQRLARIGNITADGRPILGLDSRDLLEITLESDPGAFLIPAHIWTPWFSVLGSKSGFDSIEACYGDLAHHIFALETGLSSDPPMNWRVSCLDRYRLVSNSDAHSPAKLGREATIFTTEMNYFAIRHALESGVGYAGTVEFFPEEGKYHLDGHRTCQVCLQPEETLRLAGKCPVCAKPLTVGVLNRVEVLADRPEGIAPATAAPFLSFIPLQEIIAEIEGVGPASNRVVRSYDEMLRRLGPELFILESVPVEEIRRHASEKMAEAITRLRQGRVVRTGGYDGEYGVIRVFDPLELRPKPPEAGLFAAGAVAEKAKTKPPVAPKQMESPPVVSSPMKRKAKVKVADAKTPVDTGLDAQQAVAVDHMGGPLLILAGPGTGKTRTLTHRLARLVTGGVPPEQCLAVTFTRRAAQEMQERLSGLLGEEIGQRIPVMTFHALGWSILRAYGTRLGYPPAMTIAGEIELSQRLQETMGLTQTEALKRLTALSRWRRGEIVADPQEMLRQESILTAHRELLRQWGLVDLEDLILEPVTLLEGHPDVSALLRMHYAWVFVDEFQDIDASQYALLRHLAPPDGQLCVIGDPDQSIYGFRGGDPRFFQELAKDFPELRTIRLTHNYRSGQAIVHGALEVMAQAKWQRERDLIAMVDDARRIVVFDAASDRAEAEFVVHTLEAMMGGHGFHALDSGRADGHAVGAYSFGDFAVLYRSDAQSVALCQAFDRAGIPYQKRSHGRLTDHPGVMKLVNAMRRSAESGLLIDRLHRVVVELGDDADGKAALELVLPLATRFGEDVTGFLSALTLGAELDLWDPRAQRVALLTLHGSKGLEFRTVFVTGCEDGVLPWRWGEENKESLEEERRLFFVAMTRARETLILTWAKKRLWRGSVRSMEISPFLQEIREELLERRSVAWRPPKKNSTGKQLTLSWD
ncbi:MAG: UvrD-helicase domain-containing protein [Magnetococcus sp. YQC-5]